MVLNKIKFFNELSKKNSYKFELLEFLKRNNVMTDDEVQRLINEHNSQHASLIVNFLESQIKNGKLQLVDYTWQLLPIETMKIKIVALTDSIEIGY